MLNISEKDEKFLDELESLRETIVWKMVDNRPKGYLVKGISVKSTFNSLKDKNVLIEECYLIVDNPDYEYHEPDDRDMGWPTPNSNKHIYFDCKYMGLNISFFKTKQELLNSLL